MVYFWNSHTIQTETLKNINDVLINTNGTCILNNENEMQMKNYAIQVENIQFRWKIIE